MNATELLRHLQKQKIIERDAKQAAEELLRQTRIGYFEPFAIALDELCKAGALIRDGYKHITSTHVAPSSKRYGEYHFAWPPCGDFIRVSVYLTDLLHKPEFRMEFKGAHPGCVDTSKTKVFATCEQLIEAFLIAAVDHIALP